MTAIQSETWTIGRLLTWTTDFLKSTGSDAPRLDAEVLLAFALKTPRIMLYTRYDEDPGDATRRLFRSLIKQRSEGSPVAYLVGKKEFFSLDFTVTHDVLIPRPDSEFVVLELVRLLKNVNSPHVLDIGTGSGCLTIASATQLKDACFVATDISPAALAVATDNAAKHKVSQRVQFLHGNLFEPLGTDRRFHCVMSNPPYIPTNDIDDLPIGVRNYEPIEALDGGSDGLDVVRSIVDQAPHVLHPDGQLIFEIGAPQETTVREIIQSSSKFTLMPTIKDLAGHPRVISATLG